jgi:phosphate transport system protein
MRDRFEEELKDVNNNLTKMGLLCEDSIKKAIQFIDEGGDALAKEISDIEQDIDFMESTIEDQCFKLFMKEQPVASDLKLVSAALRMIADMERIGDHAEDIAEVGRYIHRNNAKAMSKIREMAKAASLMVNNVVKAYVTRDLKLAGEVIRYDDVVDDLFAEVKSNIADEISRQVDSVEDGLDMLMIAKYLERIGDHSVNIAEWVNFSVLGERYPDDAGRKGEPARN